MEARGLGRVSVYLSLWVGDVMADLGPFWELGREMTEKKAGQTHKNSWTLPTHCSATDLSGPIPALSLRFCVT